MYDKYSRKAAMYDLLANYYKYLNPQLHIMYYQKHLKYMNKMMMTANRTQEEPKTGEPMVRIFHASPDASSVDIYLNGKRIIRNLTFKQETDYLPLPDAGKYRIDIYPAGKTDKPVLTETFTFNNGHKYTVAAAGKLDNLDLLFIYDNQEVPPGETKVRFIHLSPDAPVVDVAVKNGDVIFSDVTFKEVTDYLPLSPMTVSLEARLAGTNKVVLELPPIRLRPNRSYTIYAVGLANGKPPLEALIAQY
ncbi:DUF4397 domain-containing protein [Priestia abyssalis]|uniref:DUF4397 domain-containing protein n=1 Tax=Priestia abyssalis TaxID=1221450 RepID=UPI0009952377|nr:DUF4397 domain-containing protein [Priestia abyssalis]